MADEPAVDEEWQVLGRAAAYGGGLLILRYRDEVFDIRVDGRELMSSRVHGSEEAMARYGCQELADAPSPCVLVGGLGLGYTLAATLRHLPPSAAVVVAECVPEVVEWNREMLAPLAGRPLDDPRVEVRCQDVAELLAEADRTYDAILLDVDNGPFALSLKDNRRLYSPAGVALAMRAVAPGGRLVIWSSDSDPAFQRVLRKLHLTFRTQPVGSRGGKRGRMHYLHVVQKEA